MPLSWNEIRANALAFSKEWATEVSEDAEAKSFWDDFFRVFGVPRRRLAVFEKLVSKAGDRSGYIDLFWPKVLIAEHKSRGRNLDRAFDQAIDYFPGLDPDDYPQYVVVSDFARFRIYNLDSGDVVEFPLADLHKHVTRFGFIAGYQVRNYREQDPVNVRAAKHLADLHDALAAVGYVGHELEVYLVRVLFCLFAEDTGIFMPRGAFEDFVRTRTQDDGSDLAARLGELFFTLNRPPEKRLANLDEQLASFPYVNGKLFEEQLSPASFDRNMRSKLLECCDLDWGGISPAIFGALFQGILDKKVRRNLGAHYTSERNILKVIGPLFLDELRAEFERIKTQASKLRVFHSKLASMNVFDPACGCGNFLVTSYREIRLLELDVIKRLYAKDAQQLALDVVDTYVKVDVNQFHGIEIEEWPAQIARVAMWLIDHQMNLVVGQAFGQALVRIPLVHSANIVHANALRVDWNTVLPAARCTYVLGNPPFIGSKLLSESQRDDVSLVTRGLQGAGALDYVCGWHLRATTYAGEHPIGIAFVSTNSICQGEQVPILWKEQFSRGWRIAFAHRTFRWNNEAKGVAAVHCIIVGLSRSPPTGRRLFDYEGAQGEAHEIVVANISPYLIAGPDVIVEPRSTPLSAPLVLTNGSIPADGGNLILEEADRVQLMDAEPGAARWIRPYLGGDDFISGVTRYCLWLKDCPPESLAGLPKVVERVAAVRRMRLASKKPATRQKAAIASRFTEDRQPSQGQYLAVPRTSSENRVYIPIGYLSSDVIAANDLQLIPNAGTFEFGVLMSSMHVAWVRLTSGRLKSDIRYSARCSYNTFPWPSDLDPQHRSAIERSAQAVLDARASFAGATLETLYDPVLTPPVLVSAHQALDRAVDAAYVRMGGKRTWVSDAERVAFLLQMHLAVVNASPNAHSKRRSL